MTQNLMDGEYCC